MFRKRAPREFTVAIGDPSTINGNETSRSTPQEILEEIYEMAELFPIAITIKMPSETYRLEMDEHGTTTALEDRSAEIPKEDSSEYEDENSEILIEEVGEEVERVRAPRKMPPKLALPKINLPSDKKKPVLIGAGILSMAVVAAIVCVPLMNGASASEDTWQTPFPESVAVQEPFSDLLGEKVWGIEPGQADSVSYFAAGVVQTDESKNEIALRAIGSGNILATYKAGKGQSIKEKLKWVADLSYGGKPAVGIRIANSFVAITADGKITEWKIPGGYEVSVRGTVPLMTNAASQKDAAKVESYALIGGRDTPEKLIVNSELITRSIDGKWILQLDLGRPLVALTPVDRSGKEQAHPVNLVAPIGSAVFLQHLAAGHGYSLILWEVEGKPYLGVHVLSGDNPGEARSFVPAPFPKGEAKGWSIASGAELALLGPYAFSLETGELAEHNPDRDFTKAYGELVISADSNGAKTLTLDHKRYPEINRIIGHSDQGISFVRLIDGSVAAYKMTGEKD